LVDGNSRVARLMYHSPLLDVLGTGGVWSVARGFAKSAQDYKFKLQDCDSERRGDLGGRGNLSESALVGLSPLKLSYLFDPIGC
jgi:hypothetical protein